MSFFSTLKAFWKIVSRRSSIGGLYISDSAIQYVSASDNVFSAYGVRLEPRILKAGRVLDAEKLGASLRMLHGQIFSNAPKSSARVVVVLPADLVYTQSFSVPKVDPEKIQESIKLNLQMLSPISVENVYVGSQLLKEETDHVDVLGAFAEKERVESLREILVRNRFDPVIFEFPALSLSRILGKHMGGQSEAVLLIQVSSDGIDLLIVRNGSLYFDYFRSWQSIQGEEREILKSAFEEIITVETQKVINFSLSRFKEAPKKCFIVAPGYENVIGDIVEKKFEIKATPLQLTGYSLGPAWYVPLGSAIRATSDYERDTSIALGARSFFEVFHEERLVNLIKTWRNVATGVVASFLLIFAVSLFFLTGQLESLNLRSENIKAKTPQGDFSTLAAKVKNFNALVAGARKAKESEKPWPLLLGEFKKITDASNISIERFEAASFGGSISVGARGPDHASVTKFKNLLAADSRFYNVDLPLSRIVASGDGAVGFVVTFQAREPFLAR